MPDAKTPQKLDIQKYRSDELLTRLIDLVSIPNAIGSALRAGLVVLIAVLFVFSWLLWAETFLRPVWMIATAWSLLASAVTGSIFGLIYVLFNALKNTQGIVDSVLDTTEKIYQDYDQLKTGEMKLPPRGELALQVEAELIEPMLKVAIDRTIGLIGTPVLWLYRSTVRASIKRMIRLSPVEDFENANATADSLEAGMSAIAQSRSEIVSKTSQWSKSLSVVSSRVRNLALIPLGALAIVALLVAFLPVLILVWAS